MGSAGHRVFVSALLLGVASCERPPPNPPAQRYVELTVGSRAVDIVAVVDTSYSPIEQRVFVPGYAELFRAMRSPLFGGAGCSPSALDKCRGPDVRFGMITMSAGAPYSPQPQCQGDGDGGRIWSVANRPGCTPFTGRWLEYRGGLVNVPASSNDPMEAIASAIDCTAPPVPGSCELEQPLLAARLALDPAHNANPGFLRPESLLLIGIVTDEDDCSLSRPELFDPSPSRVSELGPCTDFRCSEYGIICDEAMREPGVKHNCRPRDGWLAPIAESQAFFRKLKGDRVLLSVIAGPAAPIEVVEQGDEFFVKATCHSLEGLSSPAVRLKAAVEGYGARGLFNPGQSDACASEMASAFAAVASRVLLFLETQCIEGAPVTESGALVCAGPDKHCSRSCLDMAECSVEEVLPAGAHQTVARCGESDFDPAVTRCTDRCPCWRLVAAPGPCTSQGAQSPLAIQVLRSNGILADSGAYARARCSVSALSWTGARDSDLPRCR